MYLCSWFNDFCSCIGSCRLVIFVYSIGVLWRKKSRAYFPLLQLTTIQNNQQFSKQAINIILMPGSTLIWVWSEPLIIMIVPVTLIFSYILKPKNTESLKSKSYKHSSLERVTNVFPLSGTKAMKKWIGGRLLIDPKSMIKTKHVNNTALDLNRAWNQHSNITEHYNNTAL